MEMETTEYPPYPNRPMTDSDLMNRFFSARIGGRVVFIECEQGIPKLTEFYERNGFAKFDSRVSKVDGKTYDMMFRFLSMS